MKSRGMQLMVVTAPFVAFFCAFAALCNAVPALPTASNAITAEELIIPSLGVGDFP